MRFAQCGAVTRARRFNNFDCGSEMEPPKIFESHGCVNGRQARISLTFKQKQAAAEGSQLVFSANTTEGT